MRETTRRQFTRGIGTMLASGTALTFLPDGGLGKLESEDDEVEYVAYKRIVDRKEGQPPERIPIYDTIDKNEWVRRKTALDVRDKMATELQRKGMDSVSSIFRSMDDSPTGFGVELSIERELNRDGETISSAPTKTEVEGKFPTEAVGKVAEKGIEGRRKVPIIVTETERRKVYTNNDYDWYAYPGGAPISVDKPQGNNGTGSLAGPFHLSQYGDGMITAGHVTDGDGYDVYRAATSDVIGTTQEYTLKNNENIDYAFVEMTSDETTNPYICNSDNTGYDLTIGGILTDATLNVNVGTDFEVETQGRKTNRTAGTIVGTVGNGTIAVDTTQDVEGGDSGGTLFSEVSSEAYIAGDIIKSIPPGIFNKHNARSTTAETVENDAGGYYIKY